MATYYLPNETGWEGSSSESIKVYLRFKIDQTYNAATNQSSLTVRLQAKLTSSGYNFSDYQVQAGTIQIGSGNAQSVVGCAVDLSTYNVWHDITDGGSAKTWSYTVTHAADGTASVSFKMTGVNLYKYYNGAEHNCRFSGEHSATLSLSETRTFTLTISAGTGSTITVKRGTTTLSNGATITYGDVLTISFAPLTGYDLSTHTVNGTSFTSGGTHTVSGAVTVAATATKKTYTLTISAGTGSTITVKRGTTTLSNGATITHGDVLTISFAAQTGYTISTHTVNGTSFTSGDTYTVNGAVTVAATAAKRTYTLSISAGTGSTITVKRGTTTLTNGATITYGDVLTISFAAQTGYDLSTHTVNGASFTSGGTHTVSGAVTVAATAAKRTYTLSISAGTGSTITVKRGTTTLSNGATITHGDVLTITFGTQTGYTLSTHTVNGVSFTSGNTHTVSGAVTVAATAAKSTYTLTISAGTGSTITVKRGTASLSNGAAITHGDVLTITFAAQNGYSLSTHTVNGTSFTSGNTHTVSGSVTVAATAALTRSTIAECSTNVETLGSIALSLNRSGTLYHKAQVKDGSTVLTTTGAFASSTTISVPRSWFSSHGTATSFSVTVSVQSYTDSSCGTTVGNPDTRTVTIKADAGMKPVLQSGYATASPYNTGAAASINKFISGYSKATVTLNSNKLNMSAAVGASVTSISVTGGGVTATSSPYRTGVLRDTATITITVTDSRGRSGSQTLTVQTNPYSNPRLSNVSVFRCTQNGTESDEGTYYAVTATLTISSIDGANTGTLTASGVTLTSGTQRILGGTLNPDTTYRITVQGSDSLGNSVQAVVTLPGRKWAMRFREDGNGVGFGLTPAVGNAIEIPEDWSIRIGQHQIWGKWVLVAAESTQTVQLTRWRNYLVTPSAGPSWIVQTRETDQTPIVAEAFKAVSNANISCLAGENCTITLENNTSTQYGFSIRLL